MQIVVINVIYKLKLSLCAGRRGWGSAPSHSSLLLWGSDCLNGWLDAIQV